MPNINQFGVPLESIVRIDVGNRSYNVNTGTLRVLRETIPTTIEFVTYDMSLDAAVRMRLDAIVSGVGVLNKKV